jgi:hypothetical protein
MPPLRECGYAHARYAEALAEFGHPRKLDRSGAWILERSIPGSQFKDGMGCYPIFCCRDWTALVKDMEELSDLVSLAIVTDPFGEYDISLLRECFPDLAIPFKHHYVTDLTRKPETFVSEHHRRNIRKSLARVEVEHCEDPERYASTWVELYQHLIQKHSITGMSAFSPVSLTEQLHVPGLEAFRAIFEGNTVGIVLWLVQNDVVYYHLGAYDNIGYQTRSSYAVFSTALDSFARRGLRWLSLGSAAGLTEDEANGLARFKRGWSTGTRTAYLCGRILNPAAYQQLVSDAHTGGSGYFPLYRMREFG